MPERFLRIVLTGLMVITVMSIDRFAYQARGQQKKIPDEPLQVTDAATGKLIPELLVVSRFSVFEGTSTLLGEGPGGGSNRNYLARPLLYRTGTPFKLKRPKSAGFSVPGLLFIGKGRSIQGALLIAPGYRPLWYTSLWSVGSKRNLRLTPVSDKDWSLLLEKTLSPLEKDVSRISDDCSFWDVPAPCAVEVHFNKKERDMVRSFLRRGRRER